MDDIVEDLRRWDDRSISTHWDGCLKFHPVCAIGLAADEIEQLRTELMLARSEIDAIRATCQHEVCDG